MSLPPLLRYSLSLGCVAATLVALLLLLGCVAATLVALLIITRVCRCHPYCLHLQGVLLPPLLRYFIARVCCCHPCCVTLLLGCVAATLVALLIITRVCRCHPYCLHLQGVLLPPLLRYFIARVCRCHPCCITHYH